MVINIKTNKDFEKSLLEIDSKYGEDFEYLNGFHESQLNFSDFIDGFIDKNVADVTIDANANAHHKDICSLTGEKGKSEDKLFAFNKIFYELKKKYGLRIAREWLEAEYSGAFYMHDAPSCTYKPYCFTGDTKIITKSGVFSLDVLYYICQENKNYNVKVLNRYRKWEKATIKEFGKQRIHNLTLERKGITRVVKTTGNHKWFVKGAKGLEIKDTVDIKIGDEIPYNSRIPFPSKGWTVTDNFDAGYEEQVYCAVVEGSESFTLEGGILTHNCYAYDLTRLAKEGLYFLDDYNNIGPGHLTTFLDDVIEFVSFYSNRSSGACGLPNVLLWTFYFWKKDIEDNYYLRNPEYYIKQSFQKFIFRLNQPFLRKRSMRLCKVICIE